MIRLNLVAVLILAAFGWVIDGFVQAATPVAPQRGLETVDELLRIVQNKQPAKEEKKLIGRTPRVKPDFISWPEQVGETEDVRLMVKFHDQYQIRLDTTGQVMSKSGQNIDSLAVILEGLNVSLEPVFDIPEHDIESLIRRAERLSGKQQPDLAANFYVNGNRDAVDQAALILLHDPRVETALFDKRVDPRKAIALQEQNAAFQAVAQPANDAQLVAQSSYYSPINESTYDGGGQLISKESKEVDVETRAGAGSCCVFGDGLVPSPMADPFGWIGGAPAPSSRENPLVIKSCIDVANNNECDDLEGIFSKGEQCDATQLFFTHCLNLGAPFVRTGGCCIEGSVETLVYAECLAEDGLFLHDAYSRFDGSLTLGAPRLSTAINPQLLASAYGLTNFTTSQNTNYSYYYGLPFQGINPLAAVNTLAGLTPVEPGGASANENYNGSVGGFNTNQNLTATVVWGLIDMYLSDGLGGTGNLIGTPAYGNSGVPWGPTGSPPPKPSGGFIFGQKKTTVRGVTYDPNLFFCPTTNDACEFGVCAMDCWQGSDDGPCGPETGSGASAPRIEPLSPILSASLLPPTTNVLCSNFVYKATCDLMRNRSTRTPGLNPSGSLFQDLRTRQPVFPGVGGCQTDNVVDDPEKSWFRDVYVPNDVCCIRLGSDCIYETYIPGTDDGEIMRGSCFFSNAAYPTMLINQAGDLQLQGLEGCYGGGGQKDDPTQCAVWCEIDEVTAQVCEVAPICCDDTQCGSEIWYPYAGWSFLCADLATQRRPVGLWDQQLIIDATFDPFFLSGTYLAASTVTDFDQQLKFGGPYEAYNPLGLVTPVLRNADGSVEDIDPTTPGVQPFVIPAPNSCKISYGVQNQCFSAYYSEFQPSLGDASNDLFLFSQSLSQGCTDFECCHRVCSINSNQTDYNYGECCTIFWSEECVDKAQEICYTNQGGIVSTATPDFAPLQFHLSQKSARGPRPISLAQYQNGMRRLAPAPTLPPSVVSPIPNLSTVPPDNWLQSIHSMQWTANPLLIGDNQPADFITAFTTSVAVPSVLDQSGIPGLEDALPIVQNSSGQFVPMFGNIDDPADSAEYLYGELPSSPISWWRTEGLSLYGDFNNQGWPQNPSFLSSHIGLYSWGTYIASFRPGRHPWGPYVNGTAGAGISIAVLDTSAWVQEYFDNTGNLVGAVHEDLTNVLMEGPVLGAEFVPMLFNPFVSQPQRGTAVLGTIAATVDGVGTDGIAPMANTMFFPTQSADVGDREFLAWVSALVRLRAGDIIAPTYPGGGASDCILLDSPALNETGILEITENLQITVIAPVGDHGSDVSVVLGVLTDNTILAAATLPSNSPRRFWSSN
ncbi:MAG: hypothetical protein VX527_01225, partial [Planctomycetota bacterium]|nr:hypothetical protein [Planctomycetota bacterium]